MRNFFIVIVIILAALIIFNLSNMKIVSGDFEDGQAIPSKFTCDGESLSPALKFVDLPKEAKSLALIVDDPDAPSGAWVHWLVWNILPEKTEIKVGESGFGLSGANSYGHNFYDGPCPPASPLGGPSGIHRYFFKLYALNSLLQLPKGSTKDELLKSMQGHIKASTELMGRYSRAR